MKLYEKYKQLKSQNKEKMYLFRNGNFYIFLEEDAERINEYMVLKKTSFTKDTIKCGFPVSRLDDYQRVFYKHKLPVEIVISDEHQDFKRLKKLEQLDNMVLDNVTPLEALQFLYELKQESSEKCEERN